MSEWAERFKEMFGVGSETNYDPIQVDQWRTLHNKDHKTVMLAFRAGGMATGLLFPADQTAEIGEALIQSARNAFKEEDSRE